MNILDAVAVSLPCQSCGGNYRVPLQDVLLSHKLLHQGCPASWETECPPVFQARLLEREDIEMLQRAWSRLETRARSDGGELVLLERRDLAQTQPAVPAPMSAETAQGRKGSTPLAIVSNRDARENTPGSLKKRRKRGTQERAHSKTVKAKNKKGA